MTTVGVRREIAMLYAGLLAAVSAGDRDGATQASSALLAGGEQPERVYRAVVRTLLTRGIGCPPGASSPHGLWALTAALFLTAALSPAERTIPLARAIGAATDDAPPTPAAPSARPLAAGTAPLDGHAPATLADRARAALLAGDGASAEWALAALLAGDDRGRQPTPSVRRAAYAALFAAAAQAETSVRGWGHLLIGAQHAVEMAELLPAAQTLLTLRPAVWALARRRSSSRTRLLDDNSRPSSTGQDALRINRRLARPGETTQWARALRTRPLAQVVEEALASGLARAALLDAAVLAAVQILAAAAQDAAAQPRLPRAQARRISILATHTVLALHAARRAHDLAPPADDALAAALRLLARLATRARTLRVWTAPAAPTFSTADLARAVVARGDLHALAVGEAILAEHDDALPRAPDVAAALMGQAEIWLSALAVPRHSVEGVPTASIADAARRTS